MEEQIVYIVFGIILLFLILSVTFVLIFRLAKKKIIQKELEKSTIKLENQQKVLQATIETQEIERERIARDLHDAISAKLNVVNLHTNILLETSLDKENTKSLTKILGITTDVLKNSRQISHDLLPPILNKFGLEAAIEELFSDYEETNTVAINSTINYLNPLNKKKELHVFRIIQELLNNALKHGEATQINFELSNEDKLMMVFLDNGKGFDVKKSFAKNGLGLENIKSRVSILQGNLIIESNNNGSSFKISI